MNPVPGMEKLDMQPPTIRINADKPHLWKSDIAASVDQFNRWFIRFAPQAFRSARSQTIPDVRTAMRATDNLRHVDAPSLRRCPAALATLRMCTAPPLAIDRLAGLAGANRTLIGRLEAGQLPVHMNTALLGKQLEGICRLLRKLIDHDIFPWLKAEASPTQAEHDRAATIVADRLCNALTNPIIRNAQERRQLAIIARFLNQRGYRQKRPPAKQPLALMEAGTYAFRLNLLAGGSAKVKLPVDVVIQPIKLRENGLPILIETKSAGDFANTNKRRKEEAMKIHQLQAAYGQKVQFVLFLCGYFGSDYLGYEAAEGIDWVWEHRIGDLLKLGI